MALCNITGTVYLPNGEVAARRNIAFTKLASDTVTADYLGAVLPEVIGTRTDADGEIAVSLITGNYMGIMRGIRGGLYHFTATVPDAITADFTDIIAGAPPVIPVPAWLQQALQARDDAEAAAVIAVDEADRAEAEADRAADSAVLAEELTSEAPQSWGDFSKFLPYQDGKVVSFNGVQFVRDRSANIAGLGAGAGWKPFGIVSPEHFGAVGDGIADDTATLNAWGAFTGLTRARGTYRITGPVTVASMRVDAAGSRIFCGASVHAEMIMLTLVSPGAVWNGGEVDGNLLCHGGIFSSAGGVRVDGVEAHGFRSLNWRCDGVRLTGGNGGWVENCYIYDLHAIGDGDPGNAVGACRAIATTHNSDMLQPYVIRNNRIHDVWGEEGDGIQILNYDSVAGYPFSNCAWSIIEGNHIRGCGRRCIKIQGGQVISRGNNLRLIGGNPPAGQSAIGRYNTMNAIICSNVHFEENIIFVDDVGGISMSDGDVDGASVGLVCKGNTFIGTGNVGDGILTDGIESSYIGTNTFIGCRRSIASGYCKSTVFDTQIIVSSATDGTTPDMFFTDTNDGIVVMKSIGIGGTKYALVDFRAVNSLLLDTLNMRDSAGLAVRANAGGAGSVIDGVYSNTTAGNAVSVSSLNGPQLGEVKNLGTFNNGAGARHFWGPLIPTTSAPGRKHQRGDICYNDGTGPETGWRCTATGTPGVWVAF